MSELKTDFRSLRDRMEAKFDAVDKKFDAVSEKLDKLRESLRVISSRVLWARRFPSA